MRGRAAALRAGMVPQSASWAASVCDPRRAFGHRADIDGLRAVAVVPVLLFHAGFPAFAGGFVGVDVFFVISGYLITSIILDDTDAGRFSIVAFYERRIRRIFPALFLLLFASSILGALVLLPDDLKNLGQGSAAAALSASNFLFWHELALVPNCGPRIAGGEASLAAAGGIHAGEGEKVDHPELAGDGTASRRESGPPARLPQERAAVELQQPDDDLADDAAADWA